LRAGGRRYLPMLSVRLAVPVLRDSTTSQFGRGAQHPATSAGRRSLPAVPVEPLRVSLFLLGIEAINKAEVAGDVAFVGPSPIGGLA